MAKNNETGHAVNANNFIEKINVVARHESTYQPSNAEILLPGLLPMRDAVKGAIERVSVAKTAFTLAAGRRKEGYNNLISLATRSINILASSGATAVEIKQGKTLLSKLKSIRISEEPDAQLKANAEGNGEAPRAPKIISVSQQGFVNLLAHFTDIVLFLRSITVYKPKETDLTPDAMEAFAKNLGTLNTERNEAAGEWAKAIEARNTLMYAEPTGAYHLAVKIMAYVAGAHKKDSIFYKELLKYPVRAYK